MKVRFAKEAQKELREAIGYYEEQRPGLGGDLRDEVRTALDQITKLPSAYSLVGSGAWRCCLKRFPYSIVYLESPTTTTILAIAHSRRQPGYRKDRI